ncbi:MAG: hypothetical protein BWY06_03182 [Candidatus Latescibacteria bacterium ADurb.Bin168]|nr:MAG: hypothetical protein BWY06_03182 [Candidatus Latescibacteria bacterium ADurb.Bin168]
MPERPFPRILHAETIGAAPSYAMIPLNSFFAIVQRVIIGLDFVTEMPIPFFAIMHPPIVGFELFAQMIPAVELPTTVLPVINGLDSDEQMIPVLVLLSMRFRRRTGLAPSSHEIPLEQFWIKLFSATTLLSTPTNTRPLKLALSIVQLRMTTGPVGRLSMYSGMGFEESASAGRSAMIPRRT